MKHSLSNFLSVIADYVDDMMELVFEQVPHPTNPLISASTTRQGNSAFCICLSLQSRTGLKPTYCPSSSGYSCLILKTTQDGRTTRTLRPRYPQHQDTKHLYAQYL